MDNRLASLLTRGEPLTRAEYRVLAHLTQHPLLVGNITVRELAQRLLFPRPPLCGCVRNWASAVSASLYGTANSCSPIRRTSQRRPRRAASYRRCLAVSSPTISLLFNGIPRKRRHFVDLLRQKESFFLYGAGFSYLFAEYLTKKLQVLGKTAFISGPCDSRNIFLSNAARYQVFVAVSRSGETEQVIDKVRIAQNVGMTIVAFTRASANSLAGMADLHFALYDEAVHFAAEAAGVTSFESNLVLLMDLLLLEATG